MDQFDQVLEVAQIVHELNEPKPDFNQLARRFIAGEFETPRRKEMYAVKKLFYRTFGTGKTTKISINPDGMRR